MCLSRPLFLVLYALFACVQLQARVPAVGCSAMFYCYKAPEYLLLFCSVQMEVLSSVVLRSVSPLPKGHLRPVAGNLIVSHELCFERCMLITWK